MTGRRLTLGAALLAACLLLARNAIPFVYSGVTTFPYPNSGDPTKYCGVREFGWPATFRADYCHVMNASLHTLSLSDHLRGRRLSISETKWSALALVANITFAAAAVALVAVVGTAVAHRRYSLQSLIAFITCLVLLIGWTVYAQKLPPPFGPYRIDLD